MLLMIMMIIISGHEGRERVRMDSDKRVCPTCAHVDKRGEHILAVLNSVVGDVYTARCLCPECGAKWDEAWDERAETLTVNVIETGIA
jgi:predicted secreted protein